MLRSFALRRLYELANMTYTNYVVFSSLEWSKWTRLCVYSTTVCVSEETGNGAKVEEGGGEKMTENDRKKESEKESNESDRERARERKTGQAI